MIQSDGVGIGDIVTAGTVASVTIPSGQTVLVGQTVDLAFSALDANGSAVAVTPGSAVFSVTAGTDKLQIVNGQAKGGCCRNSDPHCQRGWSYNPWVIMYIDPVGNICFPVWKADGSNRHNLTSDPSGSRHPSWSPDGVQIAFQSLDGDTGNIWVMNSDGSNRNPLTTTGDSF